MKMCCPSRHIKYFIMFQLSWLSKWQVHSAEKSGPLIPFHKALRQDIPADLIVATKAAGKFDPGLAVNPRHLSSMPGTAEDKSKRMRRTTPVFYSRSHYCDYWARPCMHAYVTGKLCARTVYYTYHTFDNYCLMEFVNCRENYEMWQVVHMGGCFDVPFVSDFVHYVYHDDAFLDNYYLLEDKFNK